MGLANVDLMLGISPQYTLQHVFDRLNLDPVPADFHLRIDPAKETADYTNEVLQAAGGDLDAGGKALLEEDLRSPCTEEIAVFRAFAKAISLCTTGRPKPGGSRLPGKGSPVSSPGSS